MKNKNISLLGKSLIFVAFFGKASLVFAETKQLAFEELKQHALENSAEIKEITARLSSLRALAISAETIANPEIEAEVRPFVSSHDERKTEFEIGVSQQVRFIGGAEREEFSRLARDFASKEEKFELFSFSQSLKLLYGKAWVLQEREGQIENTLSQTKKLLPSLEQLFKTGAVEESTLRLFKAEVSRLAAQLIGVRGDRKRAFAELVRRSTHTLNGIKLLPIRFADLAVGSAEALYSPLERSALASKLARAQLDLTRLDSYPKFAPRLAFERTSDDDERVNLGFQVELPFFKRNQAEALERKADQELKASTEAYFSSEAYREELALLRASILATSAERELVHSELSPELREALKAAEREFLAGQGSPVQIWQVRTQLTGAEERELELWTKELGERVELAVLLGSESEL